MKSFGKTFRTFLAMSLALCMVMSCVTVSAASPITLTKTVSDTPDANGYYEAVYTVNGISAEGGNATILVYDADGGINNDTIEYANQVPVSDGTATFTMLLDNGNYAVLAGGTSVAEAATDTVTAGSAPTIRATAVEGVKDNQADAVVANIVVEDADSTQEVSNIDSVAITAGNDNAPAYFAVSGNTVVTVGTVPANTYPLTLTVTDKEGLTGTCNVTVVIATSVITAPELKVTTVEVEKDWNTTVVEPGVDEYIDLAGATLSAWVLNEETGAYEATLTLPANYAFANGETTANVTYTIKEIDSRHEVTFEYDAEIDLDYGDAYADPAITYIVGGVATALEDVVVSYEGDEVLTRVDSATYDRKAYITLPAGYRVAGTSSVECSLPITITVNDNREPVKAPTFEKIVVQYGGTYTLPELTEDSVFDFAVAWDGPEFTTTQVGEYTFKATVKVKDANELTHKLDGEDAVSVVVEVQDNRETISDVEYNSAEIDVAYGTADTEIKFPEVTFAGEYANVGVVLSAWTCAEEYDPETPGTYVFVATVLNENTNDYKFAVTEEIKVTVKVAKKDVTIDAFVDEFANKDVTISEAVELPAEVVVTATGLLADATTIKLPITWNPASVDTSAVGTIDVVGTLELPTEDAVYNYALGEGFDGTVTFTVNVKAEVTEIAPVVVYLIEGTDASFDEVMDAKKADGTIPLSLTLAGIENAMTNIEWPSEADVGWETWPPIDGDPLTIYATSREVVDDIKIDDAVMPSVKFVTISAEFDFFVNGFSNPSVITMVGDPIDLTFDYSFEDVAVEYFYQITGSNAEPADDAWVSVNGKAVELPELVAGEKYGTSGKVYAKAIVAGNALAVKKINVFRSNSLIDGSIYLSSEGLWSASNDNYSAFRVNKDRNLEVKFVLDGKNGADLSINTDGLACKIDGQEITGVVKEFNAETGVGYMTIPASAIAALPNGAYKIVLTYTESGAAEPSFEISRTTHITDRTLWYTEMSIDGANRGNVRIGKNLGFEYVLTLDETNPDGNIYAGYKFVEFGQPFGEYDGTLVALNVGNTFTKSFSKDDIADYYGTYSLYGLANLTDQQDFYDFKFARTVYVRDNVTNAYDLLLNGATGRRPSSTDGTLTVVPAIGGITLEPTRVHTFDLEFYVSETNEEVDLAACGISVDSGEISGNVISGIDVNKGVKISGANNLPTGLIVSARIYVDGQVDTTVDKVFYVNRIKVTE